MTEDIKRHKEALHDLLKGRVKSIQEAYGDTNITLEAKDLVEVVTLLRDHDNLRFCQMMDICAVDYLGLRSKRFEVVTHLLSLKYNSRVRLKVAVASAASSVPSLASVFPAAVWWEREVFDMFGLKFQGNPDMRRILTDYEFQGHPLLKDFPLTGHVQKRYDPVQKKVIQEPVHLAQAYRTFDTESPWLGMQQAFQDQQKWSGEEEEKA